VPDIYNRRCIFSGYYRKGGLFSGSGRKLTRTG